MGQRDLANVARTLIMKKARTSAHGDYGWIEPNTGMAHTMHHAHSFAACFQHGALFKELAPFLVPLTSFFLVTTNRLMQDMVSRSTAPLRLSLSVREMVGRWGDIKTCMEDPLKECQLECSVAALRREWRLLWRMITFFGGVLQLNQQHHAKQKMRKTLRQQPWHSVAGVVWSDKACDTVVNKRKRQKEAYELLNIGPWRPGRAPGRHELV